MQGAGALFIISCTHACNRNKVIFKRLFLGDEIMSAHLPGPYFSAAFFLYWIIESSGFFGSDKVCKCIEK